MTVLVLAGAWLLVVAPAVQAAPSCDRVAAPSGNDAGAGTAASPFRSAQRLIDSLGPGQTGCFRNGLFDLDDVIEVRTPGVQLTSYPGERGTLKGELKIEKGADNVSVTDLDIDGRSQYNLGPMIFAANTTFDGVDVTNYHTGICFILGANDPAYGRAVNTVIQNSRIHDCGRLPAKNGDHGIYVEHSDNAVIRNNWIYDNADRGIQLYPDSQGTKVYGNVINGNGEGVIFSGSDTTASSNNQVYNNVISNSKLRWNVESYWSNGVVGTGNVARDNCVWSSNTGSQASYYNTDGGILPRDWGGEGFTASNNQIANPRFVDAAHDNYNLRPDSPCGSPQRVTLSAEDKNVPSGAKLQLRGSVKPAVGTQVVIEVFRHGHWKRFGRTRAHANGKFTVRKRVRGRLLPNTARLRARVPRVGRSKSIAIRVR